MSIVEQGVEVWDCDNDGYHANHRAVGKSMLDDFRRSRRLFEARYISHSLPPCKQSEAMLRGSLLHMRVLEPQRLEATTIISPKFDRRTTRGKALSADFEVRCALQGRTPIEQQMAAQIDGMAKAIEQNELSRALMSGEGANEKTIAWRDDESFVACKARMDRVTDELVIDLKTCEAANPFAFAKSAAFYGYHRQAAHYLAGEQMASGKLKRFVFVAVSSEAPYQTACYELAEAAIERGRFENSESLRNLAACYEHGDWSDPFERQVTMLSLPEWAMRDDWRM